jgi:hypothetical protein
MGGVRRCLLETPKFGSFSPRRSTSKAPQTTLSARLTGVRSLFGDASHYLAAFFSLFGCLLLALATPPTIWLPSVRLGHRFDSSDTVS